MISVTRTVIIFNSEMMKYLLVIIFMIFDGEFEISSMLSIQLIYFSQWIPLQCRKRC
jgi:hypothetical protein